MKNTMAENMTGDIISDHRERMLNLKKYYPFFRLIDTSFSNFKDGKYEILDMGYIVMAVLRFFIEENNFKEKDVTYPEYLDFLRLILKRDFGLDLNEQDSKEIADYIFDKIKNDGRPFEFSYFDPVDRKKRVSRMKIIESSIRDNTVWYSISPDAIEFYLDTKEIKDESRISVSQLLLEKMINSQNFRGGVEVVERINEEVNRLKLKKNEVLTILSGDVFAGIEAYEEFVKTGMKWFDDEEKLFKKNRDLIAKSIEKLNASGSTGEGYYRTMNEIYSLETQLKQAMNRHSELLKDCIFILRCDTHIDHNQFISSVIINQSGCRIDDQGCSADDQHICILDRLNGSCHDGHIKPFFVEHHIRFDPSATGTGRHTFCMKHIFCIIRFSAFHTVIAVHASVKLQHFFASCRLVQSVDILRDDCL